MNGAQTRQSNATIALAAARSFPSRPLLHRWQMAGAVIAALPTVIVYLALGRLFMRGLLAGSLKT